MSFSPVFIVCVLFIYITYGESSVIPGNPVKFEVPITENGTTYFEQIEIDEKKELEYFHVPAHNQVTEADYLYDFKNNLAVSRVKSQAKCFLEPLPEDLPKPTDLKRALKTASQTPSSEESVITRKYWVVSEQVDKTLLSQEAQDFCDKFPVFRLQEVKVKTIAGLEKRIVGRSRLARSPVYANFTAMPFCKKSSLPSPDQLDCHSEDYLYTLEIRDNHCTWYISCKFAKGRKSMACNKWTHKFNSMICYKDIRCP